MLILYMRPLTHDELTYATVHQQQSLCMRWGLICTRWWPMPPILSKRFIQNHKQVILNFLSQKLEERLGSKMDETSYVAIIHWFKLIFNWMWEPTWSIEGIKLTTEPKTRGKGKHRTTVEMASLTVTASLSTLAGDLLLLQVQKKEQMV